MTAVPQLFHGFRDRTDTHIDLAQRHEMLR